MKSQQILNFFVFFVKLTRKKKKQQKDENSEKLRDQGGEEIGWITWKGVVESGKNVGMEPGLKKIQKGVRNKRETFFLFFSRHSQRTSGNTSGLANHKTFPKYRRFFYWLRTGTTTCSWRLPVVAIRFWKKCGWCSLPRLRGITELKRGLPEGSCDASPKNEISRIIEMIAIMGFGRRNECFARDFQ